MPIPKGVRRHPLDDDSWLADLIGDAHVVAIGENNHHIREFTLLRHRLVRTLVTGFGFGVLALESGFAEGMLVDEWVHGGPGDLDTLARDGFTFRFGDSPEMHDLLRWLRSHNAAGGRVRFAGLDVPGSGGTPLPALQRVRDYLATYSPGDVALADAAIDATLAYSAANNGIAPTRYAELGQPERDAATTALARLLLCLDALTPSTREHRVARHHALGALRLDEHLRELVTLGQFAARDQQVEPVTVASSRDVYMAETVRLLRAEHGPDERIVLLVHNGHAQRVPMQLVPGVKMRSAGCYLAGDLGDDYVAVGVTAITGTTTDARLDGEARHGIEVASRPLDPPAEDGVEHAAGDVADGVLLDLRPARGRGPGPGAIRHAYLSTPVDVVTAFDAVACLPEMHPSSLAPS